MGRENINTGGEGRWGEGGGWETGDQGPDI